MELLPSSKLAYTSNIWQDFSLFRLQNSFMLVFLCKRVSMAVMHVKKIMYGAVKKSFSFLFNLFSSFVKFTYYLYS